VASIHCADAPYAADLQHRHSPGPDGLPGARDADCAQPSPTEPDWFGGIAADDPDERGRLLRELVLRALI
jgi:hypothetical protein